MQCCFCSCLLSVRNHAWNKGEGTGYGDDMANTPVQFLAHPGRLPSRSRSLNKRKSLFFLMYFDLIDSNSTHEENRYPQQEGSLFYSISVLKPALSPHDRYNGATGSPLFRFSPSSSLLRHRTRRKSAAVARKVGR